MQRVVGDGDRGVVAVGGQRVLHEVVAAQREEVAGVRDLAGHHHGGGDLDHRAQRHLLGDRESLALQRAPCRGDQFVDLHDLLHRGDHRQQNAHRPVGRGAQHRAQLHHEVAAPRQRPAHAAQAERGIGLGAHAERAGARLVRAEVERAQRHRFARHRHHRVAVGAELLVLRRRLAGPQVQELGAEQADAVGADAARPCDLVGLFGIGV